jgi:cytochrome c-type biogenesis protein CcmE
MAGLKKKRRVQLILLGFGFLAAATALIGYGMQDGIEFFRSPVQVAENPPPASEVFRLGGLVEEGSLVKQGVIATFRITDGAETVPVTYTGVLPDLFKEGQGMIATGKLIDGTFVASEVLAKHDENYMPREVADALKAQGVYVPVTQ